MKQNLPNSVAVLVLGILSIVTGCWTLGLILGIIAVSLSSKPIRLYRENPDMWEGYGMVNAGKICGIVGIVLGALSVIYWIFFVGLIGAAAISGALDQSYL